MHDRTLRRVGAGGLCALALAGLLAGCSEESGSPAKPKYRVALVMKSLANEFFKTMEDGARAHEQKDPTRYQLIANGIKDERDVNKQIDIVDQMIAQRVNAIVIAPADSKALVPACKRAQEAGIVVVNIDNKFDDDTLMAKHAHIPFVGPDNRKGARLAGQCLAAKLHPGDKVAIVEGIPNAINGTMRKLGFEAAMAEAGAVIVDSQTGYWETDKAEKVVSAMVTKHPDLKAILCANDSMAIGAVAALKAAGKLGSVYVVGYDNISAIQNYILDGKVLCTVDQHAGEIAVEGIRYALDILSGHVAPDHKETLVDLVTLDDLKKAAAKESPTKP